MALFKKLFSKDDKKKAKDSAPEKGQEAVKTATPQEPAQAPAAQPAPAAPVAKEPTKAAPKTPAAKAPAAPKATATKPASTAKAATPKTAPAKAPAAKAAPATKAPTAVKIATQPATKSAARPFFLGNNEEELNAAFDKAIADADYEILKSNSKAVGKYEFELEVDGYHFYLVANNGQILFDSPSFTTLLGALNGIATFKKAVAGGKFEIKVDKYNRYRFILERKYYGENYATKEQCSKCVESVKKFANSSKILRYTPEKEALRLYEAAKNSKRTPDDIDWKAVAQAEEKAQKMGKFEICCEDADHYCFYLTANNGQILYSSRYYTTEAAARKGVDSFKRAAYVGNFFVDRDKFGNYRYVLKNIGSAPSFIGESYDNKAQCEKIIDSVKNFIVTASIEVEVAENA
ncbi:MAG: DUF1508 domain-containing protein [Clostridia bacterium]|nr:DUF1508 domain-containing protein [Clostridia bacterium]